MSMQSLWYLEGSNCCGSVRFAMREIFLSLVTLCVRRIYSCKKNSTIVCRKLLYLPYAVKTNFTIVTIRNYLSLSKMCISALMEDATNLIKIPFNWFCRVSPMPWPFYSYVDIVIVNILVTLYPYET